MFLTVIHILWITKKISEILGITEGNARVKMNRAKEKLKTLIKK